MEEEKKVFDFDKEIKKVERKQKYKICKFILSLSFIFFSTFFFIMEYSNNFLSKKFSY